MQIEQLLARVESLRVQFAIDALSTPREKSTFEYGFVCGVLNGLRRIEQLIQEAEEEERDQVE